MERGNEAFLWLFLSQTQHKSVIRQICVKWMREMRGNEKNPPAVLVYTVRR